MEMEKIDTANSIVPRRFSPVIQEQAGKKPLCISLTDTRNREHNENSDSCCIGVLIRLDNPVTRTGDRIVKYGSPEMKET